MTHTHSLRDVVNTADKEPIHRRRHTISFVEEDKLLIEEADTPVHNIDEWINRLNAWSKEHCESWAKYVTNNPDGSYCWSRHGGYENFGSLMQYGMGWLPNKDVNQTVIYNTWITDGMPQILCGKSELDCLRAELIGEFFSVSGLDLIVTGHQPIGDSPLTIQVQSKNNSKPKFIVVGDTSYSGDTKWIGERHNVGRGKALSGRGDVAVTEILIDQSAQDEVVGVTYHGRLSDGLEYKSCNFRNPHRDSSLVGKLVNRNFVIEGAEDAEDDDHIDWIVKAQLSDGSFLLSSGKGHTVFNGRGLLLAAVV